MSSAAAPKPVPQVSIVITTFNRADLLVTAVDSVLQQNYPREALDILIVDDGSTDATREIIEARYRGAGVRYLYQENGGITAAMAYGISQARASLISPLDSDDYWYPQRLAHCVPLFAQSSDVVGVLHDLHVIRNGGAPGSETLWGQQSTFADTRPVDALQAYLRGEPIRAYTSAAIWRRDALEQILPFPAELIGFTDTFILRNIMFYGRLCGVAQALGGYLIHAANDWGGSTQRGQASARLQRQLQTGRAISGAFRQRCKEFGIALPEARRFIQAYSEAQLTVQLQRAEGLGAALRWIARDELQLGWVGRMQLRSELLLPGRVSSVLKRHVFGRIQHFD